MATYKVLQDIEAEDKFLGPLTLRQFIYACITAVCLYLGFLALTKGMKLALLVLLPPAGLTGVLAWPWAGEQTTEVWLLAKIRFHLKPRRRLWDQSGMKDLVTITVPKQEEKIYTNGLSQTEVTSRLQALARTIDSRGWAVKNVNVNMFDQGAYQNVADSPDRLISLGNLPQEVSGLDIQAADDIMDEQSNPIAQHFEQMIQASGQEQREGILERMRNIRSQQADAGTTSGQQGQGSQWFMDPNANGAPAGYSSYVTQPAPTSVSTTARNTKLTPEEQALLERVHEQEERMNKALGHDEVTVTLPQAPAAQKPAAPAMTQPNDPAILKLANNDDLNVATIAREAHKSTASRPPEDEVVVSLR